MPEIAAIKLQCDLVMRGGIASGLVYPRAIAKLAETYDFRSIGGTSVGAIAATGTSQQNRARPLSNAFEAAAGGAL